MTNSKFTTGAFVFTRARGLQPRDPDDLQPLALQHCLPDDIIPSYTGDRAAIGRAVAQTSSGLAKEGFLLRPIRRTSAEVIYGIVAERKDEADAPLDPIHARQPVHTEAQDEQDRQRGQQDRRTVQQDPQAQPPPQRRKAPGDLRRHGSVLRHASPGLT